MSRQRLAIGLLGLMLWILIPLTAPQASDSLKQHNDILLQQMQRVHGLSESQMQALRTVFATSGYMGQGNPAVTRHPMTPEACQAKLEREGVRYENPEFTRMCGAPYMASLYRPACETAKDATVCIDQFEFPDIPCTYPVVWVRAREAAEICAIMGKRLCDAHEWEGACAGSLEPPDYRFDLAQGVSPNIGFSRMQKAHNAAHAGTKAWSYGPAYQKGVCAAASHKNPDCAGGGWAHCGSNTYPTGAFPACHSTLEVYDLHGNAAEHMNLPLSDNQMASRGSTELGYTEMKGSWFIVDTYRAHEDWCRWRAPFWHGSRVMAADSHHNYHLGFRCCKTLKTQTP